MRIKVIFLVLSILLLQSKGVLASDATDRWYIVCGSYTHTDRSAALKRVNFLKSKGLDSYIIDTSDPVFNNLRNGLWAVVTGPGDKGLMQDDLRRYKRSVKECYLKAGWKLESQSSRRASPGVKYVNNAKLPDSNSVVNGTELPGLCNTAEKTHRCYHYADYAVYTRPSSYDESELIEIFRRDAKKPYPHMIIKDKGFFYGVYGSYLFLDVGTGPVREILIYNLNTKRAVFMMQASEPTKISGNMFTYFTYAGPVKDIRRCANAKQVVEEKSMGLDIVWEELRRLDLKSLKTYSTGKYRCVARS